MSAFKPVGSIPVASIGDAIPGTYISANPAEIQYNPTTASITGPALKVKKVVRETLVAYPTDLHVKKVVRETLVSSAATTLRVKKVVRETLVSTTVVTEQPSICILW